MRGCNFKRVLQTSAFDTVFGVGPPLEMSGCGANTSTATGGGGGGTFLVLHVCVPIFQFYMDFYDLLFYCCITNV